MSIDWRTVSNTKDHIVVSGDAPYGEWTVSTIKKRGHYGNELYREVKVALRLEHPELELPEIVMRLSALRQEGVTESGEIDLLRHCMSSHEIGNFQSWYEALLMVEMLHEGDANLPSFDHMMASSAFEIKNQFQNQRGNILTFANADVKNLDLMLFDGEDSLALKMNNNKGWYNLGDLALYGRMSIRRMSAMPPTVLDYRRIGLRWTQEVIRLRRARGGLFRKPIILEANPFFLPDAGWR